MRLLKKLSLIFLMLSGICLISAIYTGISKYMMLNKSIKTIASISAIHQQEDTIDDGSRLSGGRKKRAVTVFYPIFEFKDQSNHLIKVKSKIGSSGTADYEIGDQVEILYNGNNSQEAYLNKTSHIWLTQIVLMGLCVFFLIFGITTAQREKSMKQYERIKNIENDL